jgi:hypothetical protein
VQRDANVDAQPCYFLPELVFFPHPVEVVTSFLFSSATWIRASRRGRCSGDSRAGAAGAFSRQQSSTPVAAIGGVGGSLLA